MMMDENILPHTWTYTMLGDLCKLRNGYAFKSDKYIKGEGIPIVRISDIGDGKVDLERCVKIKPNEDYKPFELVTGDILVAMSGATTGKFGIYYSNQKAYQNQRVGKFEIKEPDLLDNSFLLYLLFSLKRKILEDAYGGAQPNISSGKIEEMLVPLPPLAEQHRIVARIEELFSSLDKGIEALKTAQQQLKVYRQAVLRWTFSKHSFSTTIGELYDFIGGGTPSKEDESYWNGDIPWASVKDIKGDYLISTQDKITKSGLENSASNLAHAGQVILITRINPGRTIITKIDTAINQDLKIIKPRKNTSALYLHYLFQALERECINKSSGTTVLGISLPNLREIAVPDCDTDEQGRIVQEIESRLSVCDKIEENIAQSLQQAEALRQSILKKAFEGTLVPQDPSDEPASVLLERIKSERAGLHPQNERKVKMKRAKKEKL